MRGCGCIEHPAFPTPSEFQKALQFAKLGRLAARSRRCVNCPDVIACSTTASAVFIPPTRGEGKQIVSGANDVQGGGLFVCMTQPHPALRATPRASFARLDPIKKGRDKKEQASLATMGKRGAHQLYQPRPPESGDVNSRSKSRLPLCVCWRPGCFIPPTCGEGKQIVSGANDVQGGGLFVCMTQPHPALRATPRASFARLDPIKKGRDKKEQASLATMGNAVRANSISLVPPKAGKWIHFRSAMAQPRWPAILKTPCSRHRSRNSRRCDKTMPCSSDKRQCRRNHRARRNAALEFAASHWPRTSRCP
jgi:hypothetical protein